MKVIIAGSRTIIDPLELEKAITASGIYMTGDITEVVCGNAKGADELGKLYAAWHNIPIKYFLPDWEAHGKAAGPIRNSEMVNCCGTDDWLLALWDGKSKGTQDTIKKANAKGLKVYVHLVKKEEKE
jgi:hypothetical protein